MHPTKSVSQLMATLTITHSALKFDFPKMVGTTLRIVESRTFTMTLTSIGMRMMIPLVGLVRRNLHCFFGEVHRS